MIDKQEKIAHLENELAVWKQAVISLEVECVQKEKQREILKTQIKAAVSAKDAAIASFEVERKLRWVYTHLFYCTLAALAGQSLYILLHFFGA